MRQTKLDLGVKRVYQVSMYSCELPVLRVLIADDHELTRFTLKLAIREQSPELELVGVARNGQEAVDLAQRYQPDVVILDLQMPILDGMSAAKQIKSMLPGVQILAYSSLEDSRVDRLMESATIDFICRKETSTQDLLSKVKLLGQPLVEYPVF
jgi:two-component system, NarL family, vancomycin resistance associated response regulator VraR